MAIYYGSVCVNVVYARLNKPLAICIFNVEMDMDKNRPEHGAQQGKSQRHRRKSALLGWLRAKWYANFAIVLFGMSFAVLIYFLLGLLNKTIIYVPMSYLWFVVIAFCLVALFWAWFKDRLQGGAWLLCILGGFIAGFLFFCVGSLLFLGVNYVGRKPGGPVFRAVVEEKYQRGHGRGRHYGVIIRLVPSGATWTLAVDYSVNDTIMVGDSCTFRLSRGRLGYSVIEDLEWHKRRIEPMDSLPDLKRLLQYK